LEGKSGVSLISGGKINMNILGSQDQGGGLGKIWNGRKSREEILKSMI
jgi:hypothetical protein